MILMTLFLIFFFFYSEYFSSKTQPNIEREKSLIRDIDFDHALKIKSTSTHVFNPF